MFWIPGRAAPEENTLDDKTLKGKYSKEFEKYRDQILYLIENNKVTAICGNDSVIKCTQIPQYLFKAGWAGQGNKVACITTTQSSCRYYAGRIAEELGEAIGDSVGYSIPFDEKCGARTDVKFATAGLILGELIFDPLLSAYSVIMIDSADEHLLELDILIAILKKILKKRSELRIILLFASQDVSFFSDFFGGAVGGFCPISVSTRSFPVQDFYLAHPCADYIGTTVKTIFEIHEREGPGDVLVFLTGREEIDTVVALVSDRSMGIGKALLALPLYGSIGSAEHATVSLPAPPKTRKVVISTNVSEGSVFVDGIAFVIDCGFQKINIFQPKSLVDTLVVAPISLATSRRRSSRAGLVRPGKCYHLFQESILTTDIDCNIQEIQRSNITGILLKMMAIGLPNVFSFEYLTIPNRLILSANIDILYGLGAVDDKGTITTLGNQLSECPLSDINLSSLLLNSVNFKCTEEALTIVALLEAGECFLPVSKSKYEEIKQQFGVEEGDFISYVNIFQSFLQARKSPSWCQLNSLNFKTLSRAILIRTKLLQYLKRNQISIVSCGNDVDTLRKCVLSSYFYNVARIRPDNTFVTLHGDLILHIHPHSLLYNESPNWIAFRKTEDSATKTFAKDILVIEPLWLEELAPKFYKI